jgi:hypothetical protein
MPCRWTVRMHGTITGTGRKLSGRCPHRWRCAAHSGNTHGSGPQWKGLVMGGEERKHSNLLRAMTRAHEQAKEPVKATFNSYLPLNLFTSCNCSHSRNFFQFSVTIVSCSLSCSGLVGSVESLHLYIVEVERERERAKLTSLLCLERN